MNDDDAGACPVCHIGTLQRKSAPYAAWHDDEFVVFSSMTIWICDVCGERIDDESLLDRLFALAGPALSVLDAGGSTGARLPADPPASHDNPRTRRRA